VSTIGTDQHQDAPAVCRAGIPFLYTAGQECDTDRGAESRKRDSGIVSTVLYRVLSTELSFSCYFYQLGFILTRGPISPYMLDLQYCSISLFF
jgi:hypothetical protein